MVKKERCRDVVGQTVELVRDVTTAGGVTYAAGTTWLVTKTHRGTFTLAGQTEGPVGPVGGWFHGVRRSSFLTPDQARDLRAK
jgi:hypothetical protein